MKFQIASPVVSGASGGAQGQSSGGGAKAQRKKDQRSRKTRKWSLEWLHSIENQNAICLFNGRDYVASCFVQGVSVTFSVHVAFSSRIVMCLLTPVGNMYQT